MLLESEMKLKILVCIFSLFSNAAYGDYFDESNRNTCLKFERGKVASCDPQADIYYEKSGNSEIFASGSAARNLTENRTAIKKNNILRTIERLKRRVFPVTDQAGKILGTAFSYNGRILTALHVVTSSSLQERLYIYDSETEKPYLIRGYATYKRELGARINYYDDFCLLKVPEIENSDSFEESKSLIDRRFEYLEMSYPRGNNSLKEPSAFSSYISLPQTENDNLVILNRNGQDFNSSGGPVIDMSTHEVRAMNIFIETPNNTIRALDLYYLNPRIEEAISRGFVPSLSEYKYDLPYTKERPPIGGRGGGP